MEDARKVIEKIDVATEAVTIAMDKIARETERTANGFSTAARLETTLIACLKQTDTCADDKKVEKSNEANLGSIRLAESAMEICPKTSAAARTVPQKPRDLLKVNIFVTLKQIAAK